MTKFHDYTPDYGSRHAFDVWKKDSVIESPWGDYECELLVDHEVPPDEKMLALADEVARFVVKDHRQVGALLLAHLHRCAEDWGHEAVFPVVTEEASLGPDELTGERLHQIYGGGFIQVRRCLGDEPPYQASVSYSIPYDLEHGLGLEYREGRFLTLNDLEFTVVNGRLIYEGEENFSGEAPGNVSPPPRGGVMELAEAGYALPPQARRSRPKDFAFTRESQTFNEELCESLVATMADLEKSTEKAWRTLDLPDVCRVLLAEPDGWSLGLLRYYAGKHLTCEQHLVDATASSLCAFQDLARKIRDMKAALAAGQWPPPPVVYPEGELVKELRREWAALPPPVPSAAPILSSEHLAGMLALEKRRKEEVQSRRETNGYVAPVWWLCFVSHKPRNKADEQSKVVRYLMKILAVSEEESRAAYARLKAGESVIIPLGKRAEWGPIRFELAELGIKADIKAVYGREA